MGIETALIGSLVLGAIGTGFGIYGQEQARKDAKRTGAQYESTTDALTQQAKERSKNEESEATAAAARDAARARQRAGAGQRGRRDTILTSGLGVIGEPAGGQKQLTGV